MLVNVKKIALTPIISYEATGYKMTVILCCFKCLGAGDVDFLNSYQLCLTAIDKVI